MSAALAAAIFVGSLLLMLSRPRGLPDWAAALGGGVLMAAVTARFVVDHAPCPVLLLRG